MLVTSEIIQGDGLPFFQRRQETIFARYGVSLPGATQTGWIIALRCKSEAHDERLRRLEIYSRVL